MTNEENTPVTSTPESGAEARAHEFETSLSFITDYFGSLKQLFSEPKAFFKKLRTTSVQTGVSQPLAFALITHWIGSAFDFLARSLLPVKDSSNIFQSFLQMAGDVANVDDPSKSAQLFEVKDQILNWIWGAGAVVIDPFMTLISILFTAFFVFAGARLLVNRPSRFETALQIVCYGMAPSLLNAIPFVGGFLSGISVLILTVIGAMEVYSISRMRAIWVVLFPKLLFFASFLLIVLFGILFILKLVTAVF